MSEHDEPLPPLESDDPEWRAARWWQFAEGHPPHWSQSSSPRSRPGAAALRRWGQDNDAAVEVLCRRRLVVCLLRVGGGYNVASEFNAKEIDGKVVGWSFTELPLTVAPVHAVACRDHGRHDLDSEKLLQAARRATRRDVVRVPVHDVSV